MRTDVEILLVELLGKLRKRLDSYKVSMKEEIGPMLPEYIFRAHQVLKEIESDLPGMFEMLQEQPSHMHSLQMDQEEWGSVVLVDLLMEVFAKDMVLTKPPETVALILTTFFEDIQSKYVPPADAFYGVLGSLVMAFGVPELIKKYKWGDPEQPYRKAAYKAFLKTIDELLHMDRRSSSGWIPLSSSGSSTRTI